MKIKANITLLLNSDGLHLSVEDDDANIRFLEINLNQEQTCQALSRLAHTKCQSAEVFGLENVGKKIETDTLEFELQCESYGEKRKAEAAKIAAKKTPIGWKSSGYFDSQSSFFQRDGKQWARCKISRWVDK